MRMGGHEVPAQHVLLESRYWLKVVPISAADSARTNLSGDMRT
jgi:hypothetical protein